MRKLKFLTGLLVVSLMAMGAGYAALTQTLEVTQSVSAGEAKVNVVQYVDEHNPNMPGSLTRIESVDFMDDVGIRDDLNVHATENSEGVQLISNGNIPYAHVGMTIPKDEESIDVFIEDAFPGMRIKYQVTMQNMGTIPVRLKSPEYPAYFVGTTDFAQALLDQGVVQFDITPQMGGGSFAWLEPTGSGGRTTEILNVVFTLNKYGATDDAEALLDQLEGQTVQYKIDFKYVQDTDHNAATDL